jgi:predicted nuclease of predicted toxin-antitoxin system
LKILADECCDAGLVNSLRSDGHDVLYILENKPGVSDDEVFRYAFIEERILLTEDKDFGELVYRLKKSINGIILIRIYVHERHLKWPRLKTLIDEHADRLSGNFVVVEINKLRFRPLNIAE